MRATDLSHWPLVQFLGSRTVLFRDRDVLEYPGTPPFPDGLTAQLEQWEQLCGRRGDAHPDGDLSPPSLPSVSHTFWDQLAAELTDGLRVYDPFGLAHHLNFVLPIREPIRLHYLQSAQPGAVDPAAEGPPRILVWFNPVGSTPLPEGRAEALRLHELLAGRGLEPTFVARGLRGAELGALCAEHDIVLYLGHGLGRAGNLDLPTLDGPMPLPRIARDGNPGVLVFGGCLEDRRALTQLSGLMWVGPECRIADRPCRFLEELTEGWSRDLNLWEAFRRALARGAADHDPRGALFRLQGRSRWAELPLAVVDS